MFPNFRKIITTQTEDYICFQDGKTMRVSKLVIVFVIKNTKQKTKTKKQPNKPQTFPKHNDFNKFEIFKDLISAIKEKYLKFMDSRI